MTTDKGITILSILRISRSWLGRGWHDLNLLHMLYCIQFQQQVQKFRVEETTNKYVYLHSLTSIMQYYKFTTCSTSFIYDNVTGYELKQLTLKAKLSSMK